jgi:putative addiction module CopG family antidote
MLAAIESLPRALSDAMNEEELNTRYEKFVSYLVEAGRYPSRDAVIEAGLRLLEASEFPRRHPVRKHLNPTTILAAMYFIGIVGGLASMYLGLLKVGGR